jgi:hypothetical protein
MSTKLGDKTSRDTANTAGSPKGVPQYSSLNFAVTAVVVAIILLILSIFTFARH